MLGGRLGLRRSECSVSSVVEHILHTDGVTGSNPVPSTIRRRIEDWRGKEGFERVVGDFRGKMRILQTEGASYGIL